MAVNKKENQKPCQKCGSTNIGREKTYQDFKDTKTGKIKEIHTAYLYYFGYNFADETFEIDKEQPPTEEEIGNEELKILRLLRENNCSFCNKEVKRLELAGFMHENYNPANLEKKWGAIDKNSHYYISYSDYLKAMEVVETEEDICSTLPNYPKKGKENSEVFNDFDKEHITKFKNETDINTWRQKKKLYGKISDEQKFFILEYLCYLRDHYSRDSNQYKQFQAEQEKAEERNAIEKTIDVLRDKYRSKTQNIQINRDNQDRKKIPDDLPDNQEEKKSEVVYRLVGGINSVREKEVARKDSDHYGQVFYELDVEERIENDKENIKTIYVFEDVIVTEKELQNKLQNWIKEKRISRQNIKEIIEILERKLGIPPSKKPIEKITEHEDFSKAKPLIMETTNNNIYRKLQVIQDQVGSLFRTEENKGQRYSFFNEKQLLELLKPELEKNQLLFILSDEESQPLIHEKEGSIHYLKYLKRLEIIDSNSPNSRLIFKFWACGQSNDLAKAKGASETYSTKYILSKFFLIPVKDTSDPDYQEKEAKETIDKEQIERLLNLLEIKIQNWQKEKNTSKPNSFTKFLNKIFGSYNLNGETTLDNFLTRAYLLNEKDRQGEEMKCNKCLKTIPEGEEVTEYGNHYRTPEVYECIRLFYKRVEGGNITYYMQEKKLQDALTFTISEKDRPEQKENIKSSEKKVVEKTKLIDRIKEIRPYEKQYGQKTLKSCRIITEKGEKFKGSYGITYEFDLEKTGKYWQLEGKTKYQEVIEKEIICNKCRKQKDKEVKITENKEAKKQEKEEHKCSESECDKEAEHQDQDSKKYYCDEHWEELKTEEKAETPKESESKGETSPKTRLIRKDGQIAKTKLRQETENARLALKQETENAQRALRHQTELKILEIDRQTILKEIAYDTERFKLESGLGEKRGEPESEVSLKIPGEQNYLGKKLDLNLLQNKVDQVKKVGDKFNQFTKSASDKIDEITEKIKKPVLKPLPVECSYQNRSFLGEYPCQKSFEIKYNRGYGGYVKRNIWGYWTEKDEDNEKYICNTCLLKIYTPTPLSLGDVRVVETTTLSPLQSRPLPPFRLSKSVPNTPLNNSYQSSYSPTSPISEISEEASYYESDRDKANLATLQTEGEIKDNKLQAITQKLHQSIQVNKTLQKENEQVHLELKLTSSDYLVKDEQFRHLTERLNKEVENNKSLVAELEKITHKQQELINQLSRLKNDKKIDEIERAELEQSLLEQAEEYKKQLRELKTKHKKEIQNYRLFNSLEREDEGSKKYKRKTLDYGMLSRYSSIYSDHNRASSMTSFPQSPTLDFEIALKTPKTAKSLQEELNDAILNESEKNLDTTLNNLMGEINQAIEISPEAVKELEDRILNLTQQQEAYQ
ncbi:12906_t:CDS:10 [Racocetra fulgida]|uniref:12906_t:CDS:1 n=1 Tax=Racocetra fulgida TaxID=60492 RepID=A0A9N8WU55_9GLOM|nr:12906_t:CDS:10 [Racocetra fulgida]